MENFDLGQSIYYKNEYTLGIKQVICAIRRTIMQNKTYQLETVSCPSCIKKIEGMLKQTEGIETSEVLFNSSRVKVSFNEEQVTSALIKAKIHQLGYNVISEK
jgi:copper chaperone CopZ